MTRKRSAAQHVCYTWELYGEETAVRNQVPVDSPQSAVGTAILAEGEKNPKAI